jgi:hypothetical protein
VMNKGRSATNTWWAREKRPAAVIEALIKDPQGCVAEGTGEHSSSSTVCGTPGTSAAILRHHADTALN